MAAPHFARELEQTLHQALVAATERGQVYGTLEHLLFALTGDPHASPLITACGGNPNDLRAQVAKYLDGELDVVKVDTLKAKEPKTKDEIKRIAEFKKNGAIPTSGFQRVVQRAILHVQSSGRDEVNGANVLIALFSERESYAVYFLQQQDISRLDAVTYLSDIRDTQVSPINRVDPQASLLNRAFRNDLRAVADAVSSEPVLNTPRIAEKIIELVLDVVEQASLREQPVDVIRRPLLTVGIYGPWGSGKSTLLRAIGGQSAKAGFIPIFVNTWKWDGDEDIFSFVGRELIRSLSTIRGLRWRARLVRLMLAIQINLKRWVGWIALICAIGAAVLYIDWTRAITTEDVAKGSVLALATGALVAIFGKPAGSLVERLILREPSDVDARQTLSRSYRYLDFVRRMTFKYRRSPLVFLFDDLDRCDDQRIITFMKSIHSLTSDGSVCILACDEEFTSAAIYKQFKDVADYLDEGRDFGIRFLEKIVQVPFRLPEVNSEDLVALGLMPMPLTTSPETEIPGGAAQSIDEKPAGEAAPDKMDINSGEAAVSEARLSEICGSTLALIVELSGVQIRQAKMLSNTVKLYSMVFPPIDEAAAQRMAAFLMVNYLEPDWIPRKYFSVSGVSDAEPSPLDGVETELRQRLGDDAAALHRLYRLFGLKMARGRPGRRSDTDGR